MSPLCVVLLLLAVCRQQVLTVDPGEPHEKLINPPKRRLSLQNTAEIQSCLISSGDVGCAAFQCFSNTSCEIRGLHHICHTLLHNAGSYDSQGKWFVKEALRCMALGARQRFSCVSRRCGAVRDMLFTLQRECYAKHRLCLALRENPDTMGDLVHFHLLFPPGPYVELVNFLLGCGEEVRSWVGRRLRTQCSQQWGSPVCDAFSSTCPFNQSDLGLQHATLPPPTMPQPITERSFPEQHTGRSAVVKNKNASTNESDDVSRAGHPVSRAGNVTVTRQVGRAVQANGHR